MTSEFDGGEFSLVVWMNPAEWLQQCDDVDREVQKMISSAYCSISDEANVSQVEYGFPDPTALDAAAFQDPARTGTRETWKNVVDGDQSTNDGDIRFIPSLGIYEREDPRTMRHVAADSESCTTHNILRQDEFCLSAEVYTTEVANEAAYCLYPQLHSAQVNVKSNVEVAEAGIPHAYAEYAAGLGSRNYLQPFVGTSVVQTADEMEILNPAVTITGTASAPYTNLLDRAHLPAERDSDCKAANGDKVEEAWACLYSALALEAEGYIDGRNSGSLDCVDNFWSQVALAFSTNDISPEYAVVLEATKRENSVHASEVHMNGAHPGSIQQGQQTYPKFQASQGIVKKTTSNCDNAAQLRFGEGCQAEGPSRSCNDRHELASDEPVHTMLMESGPEINLPSRFAATPRVTAENKAHLGYIQDFNTYKLAVARMLDSSQVSSITDYDMSLIYVHEKELASLKPNNCVMDVTGNMCHGRYWEDAKSFHEIDLVHEAEIISIQMLGDDRPQGTAEASMKQHIRLFESFQRNDPQQYCLEWWKKLASFFHGDYRGRFRAACTWEIFYYGKNSLHKKVLIPQHARSYMSYYMENEKLYPTTKLKHNIAHKLGLMFNQVNLWMNNYRMRKVKGDNRLKIKFFPQEIINVLNEWINNNNHHPYPNKLEVNQLCSSTNLTKNQVKMYFENYRKRKMKKLPKA